MKKLFLSLVALSAISGVALANDNDSSSALRNSFGNGYSRTQIDNGADSRALVVPGDAMVTAGDYASVKASSGFDVRTERGGN